MSAWRVALRIARRDALRARGRSALVLAMIALPVLGVSAIDVVWRTGQLSPEQSATRLMGQADALVSDSGSTAVQQFAESPPADSATRRTEPVEIADLLPPGSRVLPSTKRRAALTAGDRTTRIEAHELAYDDPLAAGLYLPVQGRAPRTPDEAAVTTGLAERLRIGVGEVVELDEPSRALTVVGVVADGSSHRARTLLLEPGTLPPPDDPADGSVMALVDLPQPPDLSTAVALNAQGLLVEARTPQGDDLAVRPLAADEIAVFGLVVGMALLEVVLLAGPAFAVGAKRQARQLALVAATGGERRDVRRAVLCGGLVLGLAGAAVGALGGLGLGGIAVELVDRRGGTVMAPLDVHPLDLALIALTGVGTALLAAVLPAWNASRQDVVGALTGRRGAVRTSWRLTGAGTAAAVAGALLALQGARTRDIPVLLAGSALAELGLVATTPALVGLAGRLGPRLPVAPRLALRDAARNRSRTAPAVAAVLAAVAGSVAIGTFVASLDRHDRRNYVPLASDGTVVVQLPEDQPGRSAVVADALRRTVPADEVVVAGSFDAYTGATSTYVAPALPPDRRCPLAPGTGSRAQQEEAARTDPRCDPSLTTGLFRSPSQGGLGALVVGGPELLTALDAPGGAGEAVLARGGVVLPAPYVQDGQAWLQVHETDAAGTWRTRDVVVPALGVPPGSVSVAVVGPAAAEALGLPERPSAVLATTSTPPSSVQEDRLLAALQASDVDVTPYVERGYQSRYGLGLVALAAGSALLVLGASSIATGLAAADGRADLSTLAAVGATPGLRRRLAAFQSAVTAGLGTALGIVSGLVPAFGLLLALNSAARADPGSDPLDLYPLVVPWELLAVTALVVPLLAALAAGALTRSRLPLVRVPA